MKLNSKLLALLEGMVAFNLTFGDLYNLANDSAYVADYVYSSYFVTSSLEPVRRWRSNTTGSESPDAGQNQCQPST